MVHEIKDIALGEAGVDPDACAGPAPNALDELVGAGLEVPWPEQDLAQSAQDSEQPEEVDTPEVKPVRKKRRTSKASPPAPASVKKVPKTSKTSKPAIKAPKKAASPKVKGKTGAAPKKKPSKRDLEEIVLRL